MKKQGIKWCGEGDLNPHEIAPASTSMENNGFSGVLPGFIPLISLRSQPPESCRVSR